MTQERRRYGFVLERQCSLAKHYASFHEVALSALHPSVDKWREVAATREYLPQSVEDMFASRLRVSDAGNISLFNYVSFDTSVNLRTQQMHITKLPGLAERMKNSPRTRHSNYEACIKYFLTLVDG